MSFIEERTRLVCQRFNLPSITHDHAALGEAHATSFGTLAGEMMRHIGLRRKLRIEYRSLSPKDGYLFFDLAGLSAFDTEALEGHQLHLTVSRTVRESFVMPMQVLLLSQQLAHVLLEKAAPELNDLQTAAIMAMCLGYEEVWVAYGLAEAHVAVTAAAQLPQAARVGHTATLLQIPATRGAPKVSPLSPTEILLVAQIIGELRTQPH